jgi:acyl-CoA reductase-like NAD-dependent aldehyde dehydrogenase
MNNHFYQAHLKQRFDYFIIFLRVLPRTSITVRLAATFAQAWDRGMGAWPQSSVRHRIECVQRFAGELKQRRDEIVRILMWEV